MKYIISGKTAKLIDDFSINKSHISSLVLMERAALSVFYEMKKLKAFCNIKGRIIIVTGTGNNGADGLALARILDEYNISSDIYMAGNSEKCSEEYSIQRDILYQLGIGIKSVKEISEIDIKENDFVIDCIFGIGLKRNVEGIYKDIIEKINNSKAYILSVDIPSGLSSDNGSVMGISVNADITVTFGYEKSGLYLYEGKDYSGKVICTNVGFPKQAFLEAKKCTDEIFYALEDSDLLNIPKRKNSSNKGTYKNIVIIAGSEKMFGAAWLSAEAAYRCGAGIVKIYSHKNNIRLLKEKLPEAIVGDYSEEINFSDKDIIVIGPGMGTGEQAVSLVENALNSGCKMIIDADALNIISEHKKLLEKLNDNVIITPHVKEMSRLCGIGVTEIRKNIVNVSKEFAKKYKCVTVVKDAATVCSDHRGKTYINLSGNSGMSTGGSGDVLSGIVGGILSQGMEGVEAASMAVYLHGLAGDIAKDDMTMYGFIASDIAKAIPVVLKRIYG